MNTFPDLEVKKQKKVKLKVPGFKKDVTVHAIMQNYKAPLVGLVHLRLGRRNQTRHGLRPRNFPVPHAKSADGVEVAGAEKKTMRIPIEYCVWNSQTEKTMKRSPFAFTGSKFEKDPETKKMVFKADEEKSIVAVKTDPYAIMNTPLDMRDVDPGPR